jgi:hypothetical protein
MEKARKIIRDFLLKEVSIEPGYSYCGGTLERNLLNRLSREFQTLGQELKIKCLEVSVELPSKYSNGNEKKRWWYEGKYLNIVVCCKETTPDGKTKTYKLRRTNDGKVIDKTDPTMSLLVVKGVLF